MTKSIFNILDKLTTAEPTRNDLNYLIKKSYQISISFLRAKFQSKLSSLSIDAGGIEDLAMDAIVPLFVKNKENQLGIFWTLKNWNDPILSDEDANYFLSRIIWRRVDQSVTKLLKERDPVFAKILKTLNYCISNNEYCKTRYFGTIYVLKSSSNNVIDGPLINDKSFNLIPNNLFANKQVKLFENIFEYLAEKDIFYPAIPLNLLVLRIKNYYAIEAPNFNQHENSISDQIFLDSIVENALLGIKEKLYNDYVSKNKMSSEEAIMIYTSFTNISDDLLSGGMHGSLFSYLKHQNLSLTKELYYSKYNNKVSYLLSLFKNDLVEHIHT